MNTRGQSDDTDSDEVGLVVQHALSADVFNQQTDTDWIVDSGATCHVCHDHSLFTELENLKQPLDIVLGDGRSLNATANGTVILTLESGSLKRKCKFYDVLHVPELTYNLLSISKAVGKGVIFTFKESEFIIRDVNQKLIAVTMKVGSLYHVICTKPIDCVYSVTKKTDYLSKEDLWHRRYGHLGAKGLQQLARGNLVEEFDYNASKDISFCEPCVKGKQSHWVELSTLSLLSMIKPDMFEYMLSKGKVMYFKNFVNGSLKWRSP